MKLFNQNTIRIGDFKTIKGANGETLYPNKLTEAQLNALGYYLIENQSPPNRRYYTYTEQNGVVNGKYVKGYTAIERPIDEVKQAMFKDLFEHGEKKENEAKVTTSLGITVEANPRAQKAFELGAKKGVTRVRDENFMPHDVTVPQVNQILSEIEDELLTIFQTKESKFDEIFALPDVSACIAYENEEYPYTVTQADVDADPEGTLQVGQISTRTRNKVKDW